MTHAELVDRAVRWLRSSWHCGVVLAELVTYADSIPDAIGFGGRHRAHTRAYGSYSQQVLLGSILAECKTSRADWARDRKKPAHRSGRLAGNVRYYLTPPGLLTPDEIAPPWGLAEVGEGEIRIVRLAEVLEDTVQRVRQETVLLRSACRRHQAGAGFDASRGRFTARK